MMTLITVAWRNIWRNKRRTLLTSASIFFAVFYALLMQSIQKGTYGHMTDNIVHAYTGYIQVHKFGYWDDRDLNNSFSLNDSLVNSLDKTPNVAAVVPRLETFALGSNQEKSKVVMLMGIQPGREELLTGLNNMVVAGKYLAPGDEGVLLGKGTADYFGVKTGDTLVLLGQGYHGVSAAGKFRVKGIVHMNSPDLDNQIIYMTLKKAQEYSNADGMVTSLSFNLKNTDDLERTLKAVKSQVNLKEYEVMSWKEMLVEFVQYVNSKNATNNIIQGILYMVIGFGIFGTILMMTAERIREFGVMVSLGMQKIRLVSVVIFESVFLGLVGVIGGAILSMPIILYYSHHPFLMNGSMGSAMKNYGFEPLICFAPPSFYFITNATLVLAIVLVASIYPIRKIRKLNVINALHNKI